MYDKKKSALAFFGLKSNIPRRDVAPQRLITP